MGFSRQEHWSGLPFPLPGDFPDPEIKIPMSPALQVDSLPLSHLGSLQNLLYQIAAFGRAPVSPHFCLPRWASRNPLRVSSSPGWLNSLKAPALWLQFYLKGCSSNSQMEDMPRPVWRQQQGPFCLCSPGTAPHQYWFGLCAEVGGPQFVYGGLIIKQDWWIHWPHGWAQCFAILPSW